MNEKLKANLDRVVWVVLGIGALTTLVSLLRWGSFLSDGVSAASATVQSSTMPLTMAFAVLAASIFSAFGKPVSARARRAVLFGTWELAIAVALSLVLLVIALPYLHRGSGGPATNTIGFVLALAGALLDLGLKAGLAGICWRIYKSMSPTPVAEVPSASRDQLRQQQADQEELSVADQPLPGQQPTWHPDQAFGASWTRAGDAATGAQATSWGTAGQSSQGWQASRGWQVADAAATGADAAATGADAAATGGSDPVRPVPQASRDLAGGVVSQDTAAQPGSGTLPGTAIGVTSHALTVPWLTAGQQAAGESAQLPAAEDADEDSDQPTPRWKPLDQL